MQDRQGVPAPGDEVALGERSVHVVDGVVDALLIETGAVHVGHAVDIEGAAGNPAPVDLDKLVDGADVVGMTVREDDADDVLLTQPPQDPLGLRARVEDDGAGLVRERIALGLPRSDGHLFDREHLNAP